MPTRIIDNSKILNELLSFDSNAGLFINTVAENNQNPTFVEPNFNGYSSKLLKKENWGPAIKEESYSTSVYNGELFWTNNSGADVVLNGYFIKNNENQILWYSVFNDPVSIAVNEGLYIYPKVYLNYNVLFNTLFVINIVKSNPYTTTALNPIVSINNEYWGSVVAQNSLINTVTGDYNLSPSNNSLVLALNKSINPTTELPFSFDLKVQQAGFFIKTRNINITNFGVYEITIKLIEIA